VSGMVVPLLEDDAPGAGEPVIRLISSTTKNERDVSQGWRGHTFQSREGDEIAAERGDIKFVLIQATEMPQKDGGSQAGGGLRKDSTASGSAN